MSATIKRPELVEDPGQPQQSSVKEDRAREERGYGSQEVGHTYSDADDTDDDLVSAHPRCLMVALDRRARTDRHAARVYLLLCSACTPMLYPYSTSDSFRILHFQRTAQRGST